MSVMRFAAIYAAFNVLLSVQRTANEKFGVLFHHSVMSFEDTVALMCEAHGKSVTIA